MKILLLISTEYTNVTDRQTDWQTDAPHDGIGCTYASRGKKLGISAY